MASPQLAADPARTETEILLLCARARLNPEGIADLRHLVRKSPDWAVLLKMADFNGLFPLLYWHLNQSATDLVPADQLHVFRDRFQRHAEHVLGLTAELIKILTQFEEHGILAVPYKGPALASRLYGDVGLRQSGDLDIVVARKDVAAAQSHLEELGFRPRYPMSSVARDFILRSRYNVTLDRQGGPMVELHWAFTVPAMGFSLNLDQIKPRLGELVLGGVRLRDFSSEDLLLILCVHGAKDCWYRLEWLSGVAELIRKEVISWSEVIDRAIDLRIDRTLLLGLVLAHDLLDAPVPADLVEAAKSRRDVMLLAADVQQRGWEDAPGEGDPPDSLAQNWFRFRLQQTRRDRLRYLFHQLTTPSRENTRWMVPLGSRPVPLPALIRPFYVTAKLVRSVFSVSASRGHTR